MVRKSAFRKGIRVRVPSAALHLKGVCVRKEDNEFLEFFKSWWILLLGLVLMTAPFLFALNSAGLLGSTFVERKVLENSYQYQSAMEDRNSMIGSQLAEIEALLENKDLDQQRRESLEAKARALRMLYRK